MTHFEQQVLSLATNAKGEWITLPRGAEFSQAALNLQSKGKLECDGFRSASVSVRLSTS